MSSQAASADPRALARRLTIPRLAGDAPVCIALGVVLAAIALEGGGGLQLSPLTDVEIGVDLLAGLLAAAAVIAGGHTRRLWGGLTLAAFGLLALVTALSIIWAVEPSSAWVEANRTLAFMATAIAGVALVRLMPDRWPGLLGAMVLSAAIVCGYALLTKVFPATLNPDEIYARLREPFGYWNSVGLFAAMAGPACLWLGARRSGHAAVNALAYPVLGLLVVTLLLAYSRGSLLALGVGCAVWFAIVPLRLRGVAVLAVSGLGGGLVALWAFSQNALSKDNIAIADRTTGGHELGILLVAMVAVLLAAGLAIGFTLARRAPRPATRRQGGIAVLAALAVVPIAVAGALALSQRGLGGSISKGFNDLTNVNARTPTNAPDRLTAVGSVRARYWNEALKIFKANQLVGVGAGGYAIVRLHYRNDQLDVRHAHGYVVQTAADLGMLGLAASLALLAAWLAAAGRTVGLLGAARRAPWSAERIGMATLLAICVVFGVHSFVDWTWFVPGNAIPAMLCAGWLAGRGPTYEPVRARAGWRDALRVPWRAGLAVAAVAVGVLAAWTAWQPQRAVNIGSGALDNAEARKYPRALAQARHAQDVNPLSVDALYDTAAIQDIAGQPAAARATLERAVRREPANPETWLRLSQFELAHGHKPQALSAVRSSLYLDPRSPVAIAVYLQASRTG
ncbi:MAG: O-antigen ligase family protein [Solirubrobacteraceae bacterium]